MQRHFLLTLLAVAITCTALSQLQVGSAEAATTPRVASPRTRGVVQRLTMTLANQTVRGLSTEVGVKAHPAVKGRLATFWGRSTGGAWSALGTARQGRHGWAAARVTFPTSGVWSVRTDLARHGRARAVHGPLRTIRVVPSEVPRVTAHRGGGRTAPENTMAAFRQGITDGATTLETDVQETSDGQLVLFHDATPERTTDAAQRFPGREDDEIGTFSLAELETLDAGSFKGPQWAGERIPTLDQLLVLVRTAHVSLLAEAKRPGNSPGIEQEMVERVRTAGLISTDANSRVVFESFDLDSLRRIRSIAPDANVSPILSTYPTDITALTWANSITLAAAETTAARVTAAHRAGIEVNVWTPDSAAEFYSFADAGVDSVITNDPRLALSTVH